MSDDPYSTTAGASSFHEFQVSLRGCQEALQREHDIWRIRKFGYFKAYVKAQACIVCELNVNPFRAHGEKHYLLFHRIPIGWVESKTWHRPHTSKVDVTSTDESTASIYSEANRMFVVGKARQCPDQVVSAGVCIPSWIWLLRFNGVPKLFGEVLEAMAFKIAETARPWEVLFEPLLRQASSGNINRLVKTVPRIQESSDCMAFDGIQRDIAGDPHHCEIEADALIELFDNGYFAFGEKFIKSGFEIGNVGFCPTDRLLGRPEIRNISCIHD